MPRRFFYDTEFMEEPGFLELISIGIVSEDGKRKLLAVNEEADLSRANVWVKENVIPLLPTKDWRMVHFANDSEYEDYMVGTTHPEDAIPIGKEAYTSTYMVWMNRAEIRDRLMAFLKPSEEDPVELWGYYADYDHVLLSWIFGRMVDLPPGMPKFTLDLKQLAMACGNPRLPKLSRELEHDAVQDALWDREVYHLLKKMEGGEEYAYRMKADRLQKAVEFLEGRLGEQRTTIERYQALTAQLGKALNKLKNGA